MGIRINIYLSLITKKNSIRLLRKSKLVLFGVFVRRFQFHLERNSLNLSFINFSH